MKHFQAMAAISAIALMGLMGCQASPGTGAQATAAPAGTGAAGPAAASGRAAAPEPSAPSPVAPVAFVDNVPVTWTDMNEMLVETAGGQVLADLVVQRQITHMLAEHGQQVGPAEIAAERKLLLDTLAPDPDQAQRLLDELRDRRGFGRQRFELLLARNAGLRMLVQPDVQVTDVAVRQAYELYYGPRYQARIITTETLSAADEVIHRARGGASFSDLAVQFSTDPSKAQGGLLSPISPADSTYPDTIRAVLIKLKVGAISDPVVLDKGFAILRLERIVPGRKVKLDDVKADLQRRVRLNVERMLMNRLLRTVVQQADVVVMAPELQRGWILEKQRILGEQ